VVHPATASAWVDFFSVFDEAPVRAPDFDLLLREMSCAMLIDCDGGVRRRNDESCPGRRVKNFGGLRLLVLDDHRTALSVRVTHLVPPVSR
jgi:hypothetical protein